MGLGGGKLAHIWPHLEIAYPAFKDVISDGFQKPFLG